MAIMVVCGLCIIIAPIVMLVVRVMSVCLPAGTNSPGPCERDLGMGAASVLSSLVYEDQEAWLAGCGGPLGQKRP